MTLRHDLSFSSCINAVVGNTAGSELQEEWACPSLLHTGSVQQKGGQELLFRMSLLKQLKIFILSPLHLWAHIFVIREQIGRAPTADY